MSQDQNIRCEPNQSTDNIVNIVKYGLDSSKDTIENINRIRKYRSKLLDGSDEAKNLGEVVSMLEEAYKTVIETLDTFVHLSFISPTNINEAKKFLFLAKHGYISAKLRRARASCDVIKDNYHEFLQGWLSAKLSQQEAQEIETIFKGKIFDDDIFVYQMQQIGNYLKYASKQIYDLLMLNKLREAELKHKEFTTCLQSQIDIISKVWEELSNLENEFRGFTNK